MGKYYESFLQLGISRQIGVVIATLGALALLISAIALFRAKKDRSAKKSRSVKKVHFVIGGITTALVAVCILVLVGSMLDPDRGDEVLAAEQEDAQVIDLITTSSTSGGSALVMDVSDDGQLEVGEDGFLPNVDISAEMREAKYGWIPNWVDRSSYSIADDYRMAATKHSSGHEFEDALSFPVWFDTEWLMEKLGYTHSTTGKVSASTARVSQEELQTYMDEAYKMFLNPTEEQVKEIREEYQAFLSRTEDPTELYYRGELVLRFHWDAQVLDGFLQMCADTPAIARDNKWLTEEYIPLIEKLFTPVTAEEATEECPEGSIIGFNYFYQYPDGHEGQPGWLEFTEEYRRFAGNASNIIELCTWQGEKRWTSETRWPMKMTGEDNERRAYKETDSENQVTEWAGIFLLQTKNSSTTALFGADRHDLSFEKYSFKKRGTPDEAEPTATPVSTKSKSTATSTPTATVETPTTDIPATDTPATENPTDNPTDTPTPDPEDPDPEEKEEGKDSEYSSEKDGDHDQGTGDNLQGDENGSTQDLNTALDNNINRTEVDAEKNQNESKDGTEEESADAAVEDTGGADTGAIDFSKPEGSLNVPVGGTADSDDSYTDPDSGGGGNTTNEPESTGTIMKP